MKTNNKAGFTLIELMIALAVFSIVMAAAYGVFISTSRTANIQTASAEALQNVRVGIELMSQDIRMAGYDPQGIGNFRIEEADPTKIRITADRNGNGSLDESDFENITYELSGTQLRRILYEDTDSEDDQPLIDNVTDFGISYSGTNNCNVHIRLGATEPAGMADPVVRELETNIYCRNLAD